MTQEGLLKQGLQDGIFGRAFELREVDRTRIGDGTDDHLEEFLEQGPQSFGQIFFDQFGRHALK